MFDIQDKISYRLELKLKSKKCLYTYYIKYMFPASKPEIKYLHIIIKSSKKHSLESVEILETLSNVV